MKSENISRKQLVQPPAEPTGKRRSFELMLWGLRTVMVATLLIVTIGLAVAAYAYFGEGLESVPGALLSVFCVIIFAIGNFCILVGMLHCITIPSYVAGRESVWWAIFFQILTIAGMAAGNLDQAALGFDIATVLQYQIPLVLALFAVSQLFFVSFLGRLSGYIGDYRLLKRSFDTIRIAVGGIVLASFGMYFGPFVMQSDKFRSVHKFVEPAITGANAVGAILLVLAFAFYILVLRKLIHTSRQSFEIVGQEPQKTRQRRRMSEIKDAPDGTVKPKSDSGARDGDFKPKSDSKNGFPKTEASEFATDSEPSSNIG